MQYIGEYLLTTNSIGADQDQLQKQFIFTPDMYDNPNADLENIFVIKNSPYMPQRYDTLSENSGYVVDTIEINKKVTQDDGDPDKFCSYVVTATYDLKENVRKRDNGGGSSSNSDKDADVDEDGKDVDEETPPWKLRADINFTPSEVKVPFQKALSGTNYTVDVVNTAGQWLRSETTRYRMEITWTKNFETFQQNFSNLSLSGAVINEDAFYLYIKPDTTNKLMSFDPETALLLPPACTLKYWRHKVNNVYENTLYYSYSFRMIFDPQTWKKKLLNVGTWARFEGRQINQDYPTPTQIYQEQKYENGTVNTNYCDLATCIHDKKTFGDIISYQAVNQDMPLDIYGYVDTDAVNDPIHHPYLVKEFDQYRKTNFNNLIGTI